MGGGALVTRDADGASSSVSIHPPPPTQWFDTFVPYVLLFLPAIITSVLGPSAPELFAPAILQSDGTVLGVALATFVLSSAAAVTLAAILIAPDDLSGLNLLWLAGLSLIGANLLAILLGTGSLDVLALRPDWLPGSLGPVGNGFMVIVLFLVAGVLTYGIGGAVLALVAGGLAGWRFAAWYLNRAARAEQ
ncbi:MFS family permease [Microbacterium sp. W4I20]|nr:MFS family permease [Microbacterium sp. W4I20]